MSRKLGFDGESRRLGTLAAFEIMDTEPAPGFDRLTRLASDLFKVPMALVSLLDADRQWFKSCVGLPLRETPRELAFCNVTIQSDQPLVVTDATLDPRFASNALVTGPPFVRFYAGVPLIVEGSRMGSLCILDYVPRSISAEDLTRLKVLADTVVDQMWLHRAANDLTRKNAELEEAGGRLLYQANHDSLTGLESRGALLDRLTRIVESNEPGAAYALLLFDLDNFKQINDTAGHDAGDEVLKEVASRVAGLTADLHMAYAARMGGDEFALLLGCLPQPWSVVPIAERLLEVLHKPFSPGLGNGSSHGSTAASIGIALFPTDGTTPVSLLKSADLALYKAKAEGRNRYKFYTDDLRVAMETRKRTLDDGKAGIERGEFEVFYQPIVKLRDKSLSGFEALVRWRHPERGLLSPGQFQDVLKDRSLGTALSQAVLVQVFGQLAIWRKAGLPATTVSVNLTSDQLHNANFFDFICKQSAAHGVAPEQIKLEITEGVILGHDTEAVALVLELLRNQGFGISLDDFGTGYASLVHLSRFPLHELKIDMSFVKKLAASREARAVVRSVTHLAHELGLSVVAEGIEDVETEGIVAALGCDFGQGYLFARPQPASVAAALLSKWPYADTPLTMPAAPNFSSSSR